MRSSWRRSSRRSRFAAVAVMGALALAAPILGASAATNPFAWSGGPVSPFGVALPLSFFPTAQQGAVGGTVFSQASTGITGVTGCASNRPDVIGAAGGVSPMSCFNGLSFIGPSIGQVNSQVGPTIIGSVILAPVIVSAGPVVNTVP
jgi:hypothetical protein